MNLLEMVSIFLGVASTVFGGLFAAIKLAVAPLQVVIDNNTHAMQKVVDTLDAHDNRLDGHEVRITKIETVHEVESQK